MTSCGGYQRKWMAAMTRILHGKDQVRLRNPPTRPPHDQIHVRLLDLPSGQITTNMTMEVNNNGTMPPHLTGTPSTIPHVFHLDQTVLDILPSPPPPFPPQMTGHITMKSTPVTSTPGQHHHQCGAFTY